MTKTKAKTYAAKTAQKGKVSVAANKTKSHALIRNMIRYEYKY